MYYNIFQRYIKSIQVVFEINSIEEDFNIIEEFEEEIKLYVNSDIRLEIMTSLFNSPSTLKLLHKSTGINYTSISSNIAKLESNNIVKKEKDYYYMRRQAAIKLVNLLLLEHNLLFLYDFENFLNNHQVKNDNIEILSLLPYMKNVDLLQANNINPDLAVETIQENMLSKGSVKAIAPMLQPNFEEVLEYILTHKSDFEVITAKNLSEYIISRVKDNLNDETLKCKRLNILQANSDPIKVSLVVSHNKVVMGLERREGNLNKSCVLVSHEELPVAWAYNFFKEYGCEEKITTLEDIVSESDGLSDGE